MKNGKEKWQKKSLPSEKPQKHFLIKLCDVWLHLMFGKISHIDARVGSEMFWVVFSKVDYLKNTTPQQNELLYWYSHSRKACELAWNVSASSLFWSQNLNDLNSGLYSVTSHCKAQQSSFLESLVGGCKRDFNCNTSFKHIFMHVFAQNTHGKTLEERKSLATLSRIQTEPWRWTDGDMGTGSLKSHISIYICCLAGESVTAKPNKQLLAKHTHTHPKATMLSFHFTHTHTHKPSLFSHSSRAFPHTMILVLFPTVIMQVYMIGVIVCSCSRTNGMLHAKWQITLLNVEK